MRAVGQVVAGKYRVVRQIAEGGMGVLFEAVHISLEERVAIKFVRAAELGADAIARFEREARLAVKLRTEHVARILDAGRDEAGDPFIVMEYLEGIDLGELVRTGGPLGATLSAEYLVQACHGLAEAHALTIVHRDVKPANLFLTDDAAGLPIIKVLDFGISKAIDSGGEDLTSSPERAAQLLGTPHYVSPEQLLTPHAVDARADIWSLGVSAWVIATGRLPFMQTDLVMLFANILNHQAPSIGSVRPDFPEPFVRAIDRCMQKRREDRFDDVGELAMALASLTTARTRPLAEHTVLLLERGRTRASGAPSACPRSSSASVPAIVEAPPPTPRIGGSPKFDPSVTANLTPAVGPTGGAMAMTHTMPVLQRPVLPSPSYAAPAPSPPSPKRSKALIVGTVVVAFAAVVVVLVGLRVLRQVRGSTRTAPPQVSSVQAPTPAETALPAVTLPAPASSASTAPSASTPVAPPPVASVLTKRPPRR